ncbi:ankyrin repeat domain-containing protein 65-like [Schistocerca cancellata]|uniref:ankyrin repeat domain-containing protein 65-like n=1 Tax=Schistocerca cancellata TaxID=274614 RepID=UPI00211874D3|nr:ankyrin repeat domain-containing protein 65-like [Schistocerca cancellata]
MNEKPFPVQAAAADSPCGMTMSQLWVRETDSQPTASVVGSRQYSGERSGTFLQLLSEAERGRRLIEAAKEGAVEQMCRLLAAGAEMGVRDRAWYSRTVLHWAAVWGHVGAASCLIGAGAEVDARGSRQTTPLHFAAANGHTALGGQTGVAVELLQAGAVSVARDGEGRTPLDLAMQNNEQQLVEMLQQR